MPKRIYHMHSNLTAYIVLPDRPISDGYNDGCPNIVFDHNRQGLFDYMIPRIIDYSMIISGGNQLLVHSAARSIYQSFDLPFKNHSFQREADGTPYIDCTSDFCSRLDIPKRFHEISYAMSLDAEDSSDRKFEFALPLITYQTPTTQYTIRTNLDFQEQQSLELACNSMGWKLHIVGHSLVAKPENLPEDVIRARSITLIDSAVLTSHILGGDLFSNANNHSIVLYIEMIPSILNLMRSMAGASENATVFKISNNAKDKFSPALAGYFKINPWPGVDLYICAMEVPSYSGVSLKEE